jgi:hypothetical protein
MAHVQLTTETKNYHKLTSFTVGATTNPTVIVTTTRPAAQTSRSTVFGSSLNYMKFKIYSSGASPAPGVFIYGWNYCPEVNGWVPQLLYSGTTTLAASSQSLPSVGTVYEVTNHTKVTGDAKIFSGPTTTTEGAFLLVDTLGCEYIEASFTVASGTPTITVIAAGL